MAFRQKYVGKNLLVTGHAWVINGDVTPGYVSLTGQDTVGGMLICTVSNNVSLLPLTKGQAVTVSGTVLRIGPTGIVLQPCTIQ